MSTKSSAGAATASDFSKLDAFAALELLPTPIMVCDGDLIIRCVNREARSLFRSIEAEIKQEMPHFDANAIVGQSIDVFHKKPAHQHAIVAKMDDRYRGKVDIADLHLSFDAEPYFNDDGNIDCVMVIWTDRTEEYRARDNLERFLEDMQAMGRAHADGDIGKMVDASSYPDTFKVVAKTVNAMVSDHIQTQRDALGVVGAFARGDFDAGMARQPGDKAFINDGIDGVRDNFRRLTGEVGRISEAIVRGDLSIEIKLDEFDGEYRSMLEEFDQAFSELNDVIQNLNEQIAEISKSADHVSSVSQSLAEGAQVTSAAVEEISASADETEHMAQSTSKAAEQADKLASEARSTADEGSGDMAEMMDAMRRISEASDSIAAIMKAIDDIAFQTNLLALNAAIEAARAGSHGRGFAVVAQEVRTLAARSAKAAQQTATLIEEAAGVISEGGTIAHKLEHSFQSLAEASEAVQSLISEINTAATEQKVGIAQISSAITEVASSASNAGAESDTLAASAEELSTSVGNIMSRLGQYRLRAKSTVTAFEMPKDLADLPPDMMAQVQAMIDRGEPLDF